MCVGAELLQSCLTICDSMDCSPKCSTVHRILKARILGYWSGLHSSPPWELPNPGIKPRSLMSPALAGRFFTTHTTWEAL